MTTIAYDHKNKTISCDGRSTNGEGMIISDSEIKYVKQSGWIFFQTGAYCDREILIGHFLNLGESRHSENEMIAIKDGNAYICGHCNKDGFWKEYLNSNAAIGSGRVWAIAGMDFGLSSKDAVKYASKRDCYTGGKVRTFKV